MAEEISPLENHGWWMEQLRKDARANRPEALRLADELDADPMVLGYEQAAAELRRLHALNGELLEALDFYGRYILRNKHTREASILTPIEHDCGDRARSAIARAEGDARAKEQRDGVNGPVVRCGGQQLARRKA